MIQTNLFQRLTEIVLMVGVGHSRHVVSDARHPGKKIVSDFFRRRREHIYKNIQ